MINIMNKYQLIKDSHQWILSETKDCKKKSGEDAKKMVNSYHATIEQRCSAIINRESGKCESVDELINALNRANLILVNKVKSENAYE